MCIDRKSPSAIAPRSVLRWSSLCTGKVVLGGASRAPICPGIPTFSDKQRWVVPTPPAMLLNVQNTPCGVRLSFARDIAYAGRSHRNWGSGYRLESSPHLMGKGFIPFDPCVGWIHLYDRCRVGDPMLSCPDGTYLVRLRGPAGMEPATA